MDVLTGNATVVDLMGTKEVRSSAANQGLKDDKTVHVGMHGLAWFEEPWEVGCRLYRSESVYAREVAVIDVLRHIEKSMVEAVHGVELSGQALYTMHYLHIDVHRITCVSTYTYCQRR